jgi:hypothetical protein
MGVTFRFFSFSAFPQLVASNPPLIPKSVTAGVGIKEVHGSREKRLVLQSDKIQGLEVRRFLTK